MIARKLFIPALFLAASPAAAQLPEPVQAMIDAAIATGDPATVEAVISVARTTNPKEGAAVDALLQQFHDQQTAQAELAAADTPQQADTLAEQDTAADQDSLPDRDSVAEVEASTGGLFANWSGEGQIGAFQSSGNTRSVGVSAALKVKREGRVWSHRLRAAADYQRTNGVTSREQFLASYEPRYQFSDDLFIYALAQYDRDRFQGFSGRYSLSGGIGYRVLHREHLNLSIKAGPAYRGTEFTDGTSRSQIAGLVGLDFDWQIADTIKLTQDANAVTEGGGEALVFIDSDNVSINLITGVEAKLNSDLSARLSYAIEYDSNPPVGAVKTDTLTRFTLVYGF